MSRRDEFGDAHDRSRNHADVTYGEMMKPASSKPHSAAAQAQHYAMFLRSREGGYHLTTNPALHISWEEHQRRLKARELEEDE